jgi:serine protease AprX
VERAWEAGITVVVSAGNRGPDSGTVTSPADDPYVITVGSSNDEGTVSNIGDDQVPVFSGRGPTAEGLAKPDVVSPGVSTLSLRSPGSYIDQNYGDTAAFGQHYFKGTGTSMSTATVAGVAAQILQKDPSLTPNKVKFRLMETARAIGNRDSNAAGKGLIDAYAAATTLKVGEANLGVQPSLGLGSIDAARGSLDVWVETPLGSAALDGEVTAQTDPEAIDPTNPLGMVAYDPVSFTSTGWDATKWSATKWSATKWSATKWSGAEFEATKWSGTKWSGTKWSNADWDATKWSSTDWDATKWSGTKWSSSWYAVAWN